jgi:hypothetical protein
VTNVQRNGCLVLSVLPLYNCRLSRSYGIYLLTKILKVMHLLLLL